MPQNSASTTLFENYRDGRRVSEQTNGEITEKSSELWQSHFSHSAGDVVDGELFNYEVRSGVTAKPVFMSLDLATPLGFSCFLANSAHHRKVFIPSTFNMSKILKSIEAQQSVDLVCDSKFFEVELPGPMEEEYRGKCASVMNAIVAGTSATSHSSVFKAQATVMDPLHL